MEDINVFQVMQDDEFQEILNTDKTLILLEQEKNDKGMDYQQLMGVFSKRFVICGITVIPIYPALWAFLWSIDNAYATGEPITRTDTDIFFYLLHTGTAGINEDLFENAFNFCNQHEISYLQAEHQLLNMKYLQFRPMQMVQQKLFFEEEKPKFNLDWLTSLASVVCEMTNKTSDEVYFNMSLSECLSYVVQYKRKGDIKGEIKRRTPMEIEGEIYKRTMELAKNYYQEHYVNGK